MPVNSLGDFTVQEAVDVVERLSHIWPEQIKCSVNTAHYNMGDDVEVLYAYVSVNVVDGSTYGKLIMTISSESQLQALMQFIRLVDNHTFDNPPEQPDDDENSFHVYNISSQVFPRYEEKYARPFDSGYIPADE